MGDGVLRHRKARTLYLWRGSLLPLGREAAPKEGLLRSPARASSLAQVIDCSLYLLNEQHYRISGFFSGANHQPLR